MAGPPTPPPPPASATPTSLARRCVQPNAARPVAASLVFIVAATGVFLAFPAIDLWVSGLFYEAGSGFTATASPALQAFRRTGEIAVIVVVVFLFAQAIAKLAAPKRPSLVPPNVATFLLATLAVGPGLIVNVVLKNNWGRPRPRMIEPFGGEAIYVPVWQISDHCADNCSFVSGEASSALWLTAIAFAAPRGLRLPIVLVVGAYAVLLSLNRIAFGGHFLSDVLIAWGITLVVVFVGHRLMVRRPPAWLAGNRLEDRLTRLGHRLRNLGRGQG